jgi:hypothetical protein
MFEQNKRHDGYRVINEALERGLDKHQHCTEPMRGGDPRFMRRRTDSATYAREDRICVVNRPGRAFVSVTQRHDASSHWEQYKQRAFTNPLENYYSSDVMADDFSKGWKPKKNGQY